MAGITDIESISSSKTYEKYKDKFTDKDNDLITIDNFYSLLVAEMQNQDPLEPTSNTEFISQMANFTALQAQQDSYKTQQLLYANSLVGSTVTVSKGDGNTETGIINYVISSGDTPQVNINGTNYKLSQIAQVHDTGNKLVSSIGDYGAFAAGILGKSVVVQSIDAVGTTYMDEGVVDSLEIEDGNVRVIVNGYAYDVTDVLRVAEPEVEQAAAVASNYSNDNDTVNTVTAQEAASTTASAPAQTAEAAAQESEEDDVADIEETAASNGTGGSADLYELFE